MSTDQAELFKILGVESRIKIIEVLKEKGPLCVNAISEEVGITASAVSQHLRVLRQAGLVRNERRGYWIPYEIEANALERCGEFLSEVCTCGCRGRGRIRRAEVAQAKDKLPLLRKYERELQKELKEVRAEIEKVQRG